MTAEQKGIENIWKIIDLILESGNVIEEIVQNKGEVKWYQRFLIPLGQLGDELIALFGVRFDQIIPEYKDIDEQEKAELIRRAKEKFDISDDHIEEIIESCFSLAFKAGDLIKECWELSTRARNFA